MSTHYSGDFTIEYPNEPYFIKLADNENMNSKIEDVDEKSAHLFGYLYELSKKEQSEAIGLYPILQEVKMDSMEFYNSMLELIKAGYIVPDFITCAPARVLVLKNNK